MKLEAKKVAAILEPHAPEDEDLLFFKSMIPYMKQLHPLQKLRFRSTIQDTFLREISSQQFSNDQNMTNYYTNSPSSSSTSDSNNSNNINYF